MENNVLKTQKLLKPKHNTESEFLMKTNNVDFGKSFKLKAKLYDTIYTCHSVGDTGRCKVTWTEDGEEGSTSYKASTIAEYIKDGDWIVLPSESADHTRECIDKLNAWIGCMSYNDSYFGEPAGMLKSTIRQLDKTYKEDTSHNTEKPTENTSEDNLLNEIKAFTTTSKHSVNIYNGAYEVFRSGEDMAYQCKDNETLKSVMQALSVLDKVVGDA